MNGEFNLPSGKFSGAYAGYNRFVRVGLSFFRRDIGIDADNLSKPVWDCLKGTLFVDDKQIKMRIAGSFDLISSNLTVLDFSGLPGALIDVLLTATETEEHVLYVECGRFTIDMVRLNLERNGN